MPAFLKQRHCPSSELLAAHAAAKPLSPLVDKVITRHLETCEFCSAEWSFLKKAAPCDEKPPEVEIPLALRLIAENLLAKLQAPEVERERAA
jgi:hypothetical protein